MSLFKHFVITQFNLRLWKKDKSNVSTQTEEWLNNRFDLFDKYCFPSVISQTNTNFIWLCLFDINTPEHYRERINTYHQRFPQFKPCYLDHKEMANLAPDLRTLISQYATAEDEYIFTTNLDNDDAIHCRMIEVLQSTFRESKAEGLYSYNHGYQYYTRLNLALKMWYPHNHFLTLVEKNTGDSLQTVKAFIHSRARFHFKNTDIKQKPYWLEFVHDGNVANDFLITIRVRYYPVFRTISFSDFGLDLEIKWYQGVFNTLVKLPLHFVKVAYRKLRKKMH